MIFFVLLLSSILCPQIAQGSEPARIVSLALAADEVLVELLPACKKMSSLLAVSTIAEQKNSSYITDKIQSIPHRVHSEPESILKLKPDLVIAAAFNRPELLERLKKLGIPLRVLSEFSTHKDIANNIRLIGKATGCIPEGEVIAKSFLDKIEKIRSAQSQQKLETAVSWSSDLTVMAGDTLFDDLLKINHLSNAATKAGLRHWPRVTPESLRLWNPDWIVIGCEGDECKSAEDAVIQHAAWRNLIAVKKRRFIKVPTRALVSTSQYFGTTLPRPAAP